MKFLKAAQLTAGLFILAAILAGNAFAESSPSRQAVAETYVRIAEASYADSLATAQELKSAVQALIAAPSATTLNAARDAWLAARVPYQQTEVYRFGNAIVDDWEGKVNAWPLDEGLIDYVSADLYGMELDENPLYTFNVIANAQLIVNGTAVDASAITPALLAETLHEAEGVEANVATGYHAIEFLLWGQDVNGTGQGAGVRPASDFDPVNCTGGNCARRTDYLTAVTELLIDDLSWMAAQWALGGAARTSLLADADSALLALITGMGSLAYGELAGERMQLGLLLHDPEEEHDCFSDNTHASHYYDALGIRNVYTGSYALVGGGSVSGLSLSDLVSEADPALDIEINAKLDDTMAAMAAMVARAEGGEAYDQMIGEGNTAGNAIVQAAINALISQTRSVERVIGLLGIDAIAFEGSDSLDKQNAVFE
jgi:putative iron-regulated protein